jgi:hypothetical protein
VERGVASSTAFARASHAGGTRPPRLEQKRCRCAQPDDGRWPELLLPIAEAVLEARPGAGAELVCWQPDGPIVGNNIMKPAVAGQARALARPLDQRHALNYLTG